MVQKIIMLKYFLCILSFVFISPTVVGQTALQYFISADKKHKTGDYAGAIEDYTKSISLDSTRYLTYNTRGIAKNDTKDFTGALQDYNMAIL